MQWVHTHKTKWLSHVWKDKDVSKLPGLNTQVCNELGFINLILHWRTLKKKYILLLLTYHPASLETSQLSDSPMSNLEENWEERLVQVQKEKPEGTKSNITELQI